MTLTNIKKMKDERGFTIVELLIVIVVIAILAAIVIVAYAGVTSRANTSKAQANAVAVQKVAETINADNGSYPAGITAFSTGSTTTKLPAGVTIVSTTPSPTTQAGTATKAAADIPTTGNSIYNTIAVYTVSGGGGGVIYYRDGTGAISSPTYYGTASSASVYAALAA
jgi:prepilin-type N-terminal cleavage/methylation domain-containing protein